MSLRMIALAVAGVERHQSHDGGRPEHRGAGQPTAKGECRSAGCADAALAPGSSASVDLGLTLVRSATAALPGRLLKTVAFCCDQIS